MSGAVIGFILFVLIGLVVLMQMSIARSSMSDMDLARALGVMATPAAVGALGT